MQERERVCEGKPGGLGIDQISKALHDLCQPLTALQCRLEIAKLSGSAEECREGVEMGLVECGRLIDGVGLMREIVRAMRLAETEVSGAVR